MHELVLAQNILDIVCTTAKENGLEKVSIIQVVGGELGGIVPDALEFGLEISSVGTVAEGAKLSYKELPALIRCSACSHEFGWKTYGYSCPKCTHLGGEMIQGHEFYVDYIEGDQEEELANDSD